MLPRGAVAKALEVRDDAGVVQAVAIPRHDMVDTVDRLALVLVAGEELRDADRTA